MKSQRRAPGGQPPHLAWSSYLLLLVSLMAYNTWGCVTRGSGNDGLRLHGGNEDEAGFPQYLVNNTGYRICTVGWSVREAKAFCFSLGYEGFLGFNDNFTQAPESHDIMYRTFARCKGNEICIEDCEGHQWMKITKGVNNNGMSECYNQPSMEIRCSVNPPVTPTNPVAPAVAMALEPVTPRLVEEVAKNGGGNPAQAVGALAFGGGAHAIADSGQSKFASLQAAPTTTMSPMQRTTKKETTTKPVFTTPYTGPTTTTISTTTQSSLGALTTPTTKSPEGTTARPPLGVSSYGDNNECPGFTGTYQMETTTSGKLSSPNYPNNYPANIRCRWVIRVKAGNVVEFSFDDFKIHQYDYVRIHDNDPQGSVITELSGDIADPNRIPVSNTTRRRRDIREKRATQNHVYATSGDQAYVDFYSDDAHTDRGFKTSFKGAVPASGAAEEEKANNNWIIIVIILLLLFLLIIALLLIYCWWKKKKEKQKDEKQLLYSKDGKMTVDPKSDYNAVAKSVESLFCVEGENDKANLIEGYKDTIVVFGNPSYRKKNNRVGSVTSLEQKSDDIKQQMASTGLPDPPSRPGSGMRTPRPFVKDGVVMMLPRIDNYTPDEGPPPQPQQQPSFERQMSNEQNETPRRKSLMSRDSKVAPLDPAGSNVKSTITMNPRSEATTDPEGVICANNKYSIVATVDGKKFGELDPVQSVPPDFLCPITNKLMKNPYMGNDGKSYEKKAISAWLAKKQTSPVTDEPMTEEDLKPNAALKSRIKQWKKQKEITKDRADREASASHTNAIGDIDC